MVIDYGLLYDGLYKLFLDHSFEQSFFINSSIGNKRGRINENSPRVLQTRVYL